MKLFTSLSKKQLQGKTVLARVDLNVLNADIKNSLRIARAIETIQLIRTRGARVVVLSHRGRPQGTERHGHNTEPHGQDAKLSLKAFVEVFEKALKEKVVFIHDITRGVDIIQNSDANVFLCENLRFWNGEEKNSAAFAKQLARMGVMYVNDAFANSHRKHASVSAITRFLPSYMGPTLAREIFMLDRIMHASRHPFVAILGGVKVSDKIHLLRWFARHADLILTGGGIANTFLDWCRYDVGNSIHETSDHVEPFIKNKKFIIPQDTIVYRGKILDIGPQTARAYADSIKRARVAVWNGPLGNTDSKRFCGGSRGVWRAIEARARADKNFYAVVGGGETTAFVLKETKAISNFQFPISNKNIPPNVFLSTGGGAMLEFLSGKKLPGIEALKYNANYANVYANHAKRKK